VNALRWLLTSIAGLAAAGWILMSLAGNSFRASFGASEHGPLRMLLPVAVALVLMAAPILPERRLLLHVGAAVSVGLLVWCVFLFRETLFFAGMIGLYSAAWLWYYYRAVWDASATVPAS
jgi:hypothetical protein